MKMKLIGACAPRRADSITFHGRPLMDGDVLIVEDASSVGRGPGGYCSARWYWLRDGAVIDSGAERMKPYQPTSPVHWCDGVPYTYDEHGNYCGDAPFDHLWLWSGVWRFERGRFTKLAGVDAHDARRVVVADRSNDETSQQP